MTIKKGLFFAFAALILMIPIYVAVSSQNVLNNGKLYKFKPMVYDPFDPFRGKFLRVNYRTDNIPTKFDFDEGETAYVSLGIDKEGFAFFEEVFKSPPKKKDYLKTKVIWAEVGESLQEEIARAAIEDGEINIHTIDTRNSVNIEIPDNMNKYFINENDALTAENVLREKARDIYIGVRVLDGQVRLEDIYVYDQPILEYLDKEGRK